MYLTNLFHLRVYYDVSFVFSDNSKQLYVDEKEMHDGIWTDFFSFGYCNTRQSVLLFNWCYHETMSFNFHLLMTIFLKKIN